ncbi:MAG TPA: winged helix-turn-helix domain-containing protein [Patescibacteria group bacterium]|nr:winged helix-turn-helix domain-containing protein [Patescibacteria group bacterium]
MELEHFAALYPDTSRFTEIEKLVSYIKEGNSCQLIGLPGVGRGALLEMLAYNHNIRAKHLGEKQKWFHFVLVNFSEMRSRDPFTVTKFLFLSLVDSLRERGWMEEYSNANEIFKESLRMQDEMVLFAGLKRTIDYLAIEKQFNIVFLFDRFEEYVPVLGSEFFADLRVLRNRAKYRFSVVFSLNKPLEDLVEPALFAEFHEFLAGHRVYVSLKDEPGLKFRLEYLCKVTGKTIEKDLEEKIIELTGGHGKLTRLAAETVLGDEKSEIRSTKFETNSNDQKPNEINSRHAEFSSASSVIPAKAGIQKGSENARILDQVQNDKKELVTFLLSQRTVGGGLKEIWRSFSPVEQSWILGKNRTEENKAIEEYMRNLQFIIDGKIQIPLLQIFLDQEQVNLSAQNEKIVFDENTNTISKGKLILSDDLTSAEFRLLKYFLQNSEQIIDREKIINVVWGESASTAGVTDQAVDQLIFRLRKKIEENPNQPRHLQTVKGRGFRFTA